MRTCESWRLIRRVASKGFAVNLNKYPQFLILICSSRMLAFRHPLFLMRLWRHEEYQLTVISK
ncbi:hypothetical protein HPB50_023270 [Hyalomma asiaticum]|uniref:Uncharacterized protein n=1 Tax=Hyalomma asiaticum TaxID=266040 RepID=A0ACB7S8L5_HYAAI|nr:hypothetical protein HPB50_023270 [Hyalomma asiaticum]